MDEAENLPRTMAALFSQVYDGPWHVYVCVNQPDEYWSDEAGHFEGFGEASEVSQRHRICENNRQTMEYLRSLCPCQVSLIDRSSPGLGWQGKKRGVGWARKVLFDHILSLADERDIILSLDADTLVGPGYLQHVAAVFEGDALHHPLVGLGKCRKDETPSALSLPYRHPETGSEDIDRAMLHYEIYMRLHLLQLMRIGSPYAFTAIGSAIALRASALRRIGSITPTRSGEDFYLLQKVCKTGLLSNWCQETVEPATRFSSRVCFGTGPALIRGAQNDWEGYPIFPASLYNIVAEAYKAIPQLMEGPCPDNGFLNYLTAGQKDDFWKPLRNQHHDLAHFTQAFHEKADALRILQYLKLKEKEGRLPGGTQEGDSLREDLRLFGSSIGFPFSNLQEAPLACLRELRQDLFEKEMRFRRQ